MNRAPVAIVLTASGSVGDFTACVESLEATVGRRDEVVCVVDPADRARAAVLRGRNRIRPVDAPPGGQGERWAAGLAATGLPLVCLLDGDVILTPHWLDLVAAQFADPGVVAAGPRVYRSIGEQQADTPLAARESVRKLKEYARQWRVEHRGQVRTVDRLGPVCAAFRRSALERVPLALDLPYHEIGELGRITVVDESLVAHAGLAENCGLRPGGPPPELQISASMIVKDEERVLGATIDSLLPLVDEVVVYDTGSTDRTREVAREHGARVVDGYWNDHFGDARNRGIAHCRGEFVVIVDADEVAEGDPAALRAHLGQLKADPSQVMVHNAEDARTISMLSVRIFRRDRCRYISRLHEQVADRITGEIVGTTEVAPMALHHSGYTTARFAGKDKALRNLRLARLTVERGGADARAYADLARSELAAGNTEKTIEACEAGLKLASSHYAKITLLTWMTQTLVNLRRFDEAEAALERLRAASVAPITAQRAEVYLRVARKEYSRALELIDAMPDQTKDDIGITARRHDLVDQEVTSLAGLGRHGEAAQVVRRVYADGELSVPLDQAAAVVREVGESAAALAALLPERRLRSVLTPVGAASPAVADEFLEALWARFPGAPVLLVLATRLGWHVSPARALEWSARLRQAGHPESCPLLDLARNAERTARDRVVAAAIALTTFDDERAMPLLEEALAAVPPDAEAEVVAELRVIAPALAQALEPASTAG